jgi:hypothetical protein
LPWLAQKEDLGNQQYIIVKDYKPVLAESSRSATSQRRILRRPSLQSFLITWLRKNWKRPMKTALIKPVVIKDEIHPEALPQLPEAGHRQP